ncbi:gamma-glutamyltransferase, partial [Klebsiella pneumoniae]|nr:gamma-glutamyltransferase [Klebsiella pneumoniae]
MSRKSIAVVLPSLVRSIIKPPPPVSYGVEEDVFHPVRARQGMVASVDALATRVGVDILRQG